MMVRDRLRKMFSSKAFYIVFSVLASVTIWLYVAYIENPDAEVSVKGINIEYLNEDYVTDRGLIITQRITDTLTLSFKGERNSVTQLSSTNFTVSVDLSEIKTTGIAQLQYTKNYPPDITVTSISVTSGSVDYITVSVDNLVDKEIPVRSEYSGDVAEGYQAEPIELTPDMITVSGPEEIVSQISHATVSVPLENISKTVEDDFPLTLIDEAGHEVVSDLIISSQSEISVVIPVVMIKEVQLNIKINYGAGADETNTTVTISPSVISVSGDAETLESFNQIPLGLIDVTQFSSGTTVTLPIFLPNDTTNLTGTTEATVSVTFSGLESSHIIATNIQVTNVTQGYTATIITESLDILLRGKAGQLDNIAPENIRIAADLSEYAGASGTYSVLATVNLDGISADVGAIGEYTVTVTMIKD